jgi:signal transduction histidine kinase
MQRAARGVEVRGFEEEVVFDDGSRLHLFGNAMPLYDPEGKVRGAIGAFVDITQRKLAEEALKDADRRKDDFLAMLAHELRNPLAPIRNAVQVMRHLGSQDPRLQEMRDVVDRQTDQLAHIVDDLLDISRISLGKVVLRKEKTDLSTIIGRAVETSRPFIAARGHRLTVSLPPESLQIDGDVTRLVQVVSNLLHNAAKYTETGGDIWVTAEGRGPEVQIRVKDNGVGIPAAVLPHVFDLFTQSEHTLGRSEGGLGIGLTLVKNIVEMHGGTVRVLSAGQGQGTEVVVSLPAATAPSHPALAR